VLSRALHDFQENCQGNRVILGLELKKELAWLRYKLFPVVVGFFVAVLLISNTTACKIVQIGPFLFDGGTLVFPISYIFGDVLTEVYGYKRSRIAIWTGFGACALMALVYQLVGLAPPAPEWGLQDAYQSILGQTPRIVLASLIAFWSGEFTNAYVLAKMKMLTRGRWLWTRTIGSTVCGEFVDSFVFVVFAFSGLYQPGVLAYIILSNYVFKTLYEALATPFTYILVGWLKKVEKCDVYDYDTRFNPFLIGDFGDDAV